MNYIDLLKVGSEQQEAAIAYSKITEPTVDMGGVEVQSGIALLINTVMIDGSTTDSTIFGDYDSENDMYTMSKDSFESNFGDILHEGFYNFYTDLTDISDVDTDTMFGSMKKINGTARVTGNPLTGSILSDYFSSNFGSVGVESLDLKLYTLVPDDSIISYFIRLMIMQTVGGNAEIFLRFQDFGVPVIVINGDGLEALGYGENGIVIYGFGIYKIIFQLIGY